MEKSLCVLNSAFSNTMTTQERELADALRERLTIISDRASRSDPNQHIKRLRDISERIERLAASLPQPIPPRLAHFLDRRSYDKALEFLCPSDRSLH
jgi:hypothetical protein